MDSIKHSGTDRQEAGFFEIPPLLGNRIIRIYSIWNMCLCNQLLNTFWLLFKLLLNWTSCLRRVSSVEVIPKYWTCFFAGTLYKRR